MATQVPDEERLILLPCKIFWLVRHGID